MAMVNWLITCPACRAALGQLLNADERLVCHRCGAIYTANAGIWTFLPPERAAVFAPFLRDYAVIRQAEGRGFDTTSRCLALPDCPASDPLAWQWRMRATSFAAVRRHVLGQQSGLRILDLGAGVGWLSHRLAQLGHHPCAVDLTIDEGDGLGAARHYAPSWPRLQAEFDHVPIADAQADVVIFNASLHYSIDYAVTLAEALRTLRPDGRIVVMDSPIYRADASGQQMVSERQAAFERSYGIRSNALPNIGYLTWSMLPDLAARLGLRWQIIRPWYGWRWSMRPLRARLNSAREPSTFAVLVARGIDAETNLNAKPQRRRDLKILA